MTNKLIYLRVKIFISKTVLVCWVRVKILDLPGFHLISGSLIKPILYYLQLRSLPRAIPQVWFLAKGTEKKNYSYYNKQKKGRPA